MGSGLSRESGSGQKCGVPARSARAYRRPRRLPLDLAVQVMQTFALRRPEVTHRRCIVFVSHEHLNRSQVHARSLQHACGKCSPELVKLTPKADGVTRQATFTMAAVHLLSLDDSLSRLRSFLLMRSHCHVLGCQHLPAY